VQDVSCFREHHLLCLTHFLIKAIHFIDFNGKLGILSYLLSKLHLGNVYFSNKVKIYDRMFSVVRGRHNIIFTVMSDVHCRCWRVLTLNSDWMKDLQICYKMSTFITNKQTHSDIHPWSLTCHLTQQNSI